MTEEALFKSRMCDLSREAYDGGYYTASQFLTLSEQADLARLATDGIIGSYTLDGGFEGAERRLALFGDAALFGYDPIPPTTWLAITPTAPKFADTLSHRDFLGTLMGLGIKRELFGDILIVKNVGYLYLLESIAPYVIENLTRTKHTEVKAALVDAPPSTAIKLPEITLVVTAGERLDAVIAAVYKLSRQEAQAFIERGLCALDGRVVEKPATSLKSGVTVSLRGKGRFRYEGIDSDTRKGKLRIAVRIFL